MERNQRDSWHTVNRIPGETELTLISGAEMIARDFIRWIRADFVTA